MVNALAFKLRFICTARLLACIFTLLKSLPMRFSIKDRVLSFNDEPLPLDDWMEWAMPSPAVAWPSVWGCRIGLAVPLIGFRWIPSSSFSHFAHLDWNDSCFLAMVVNGFGLEFWL